MVQTLKISAVIPVYNSEAIVGETIDRTVAFFEQQMWDYELILVNDNSPDKSWQVIQQKAQANPHITAINLLKNYGQHTAVFCGLQHSTGDYVATLDDDLQNPPEEIAHLMTKALEGHDMVYGRFRQKAHSPYRRYGSWIIGQINRRIFNQPTDLVVTNFRLMRRDVVDRICAYRTSYPYITGLSLMFSSYRVNVLVDHHPRKVGKSNYNFVRIASLVMRILFNYSSWPLRVISLMGFLVAVFAFLLGGYYLLLATFYGVGVPGWASMVVLLSFFSGVNIIIVSMLGEYLIRLVKQVSEPDIYHIKEIINHER